MTHTPHLLGIAGSLRRQAHSTAVLHALADLAGNRAKVSIMTLHDVPLYNGDLDPEDMPAGAAALKAAIAAADGLIICSPEYNYGIPGVVKNAIDWASRPGFKSPLKGKPALIVTSSTGVFGGVRAQAQIREALSSTLARPIVRPHLAIPAVDKKMVDGRVTDEFTLKQLGEALDDLLREVAMVRAAG